MKAIIFSIIVISLLLVCCFDLSSTTKINVGVMVVERDAPEMQHLLKWGELQQGLELHPITLQSGYAYWKENEVIWIHLTTAAELKKVAENTELRERFLRYWSEGGKILLTDLAATLPHQFGLETRKPEIKTVKIKDDWNFDKKGLQSFRGHPVFHGLFGGTYIFDGTEDQKVQTVGYFENRFPVEGKVVAVEKSYIRIHAQNKLAIEYVQDQSRLLAVGGYVYFARSNHLTYRRDRFLNNCFRYLTGRLADGRITYWQNYRHVPREFEIRSAAAPELNPVAFLADLHPEMKLSTDYPSRDYYDVAGRRCLVMGKEKTGIDEIWTHPFRVLRDYEAGFVLAEKFYALGEFPARLKVLPEAILREYQLPQGNLKELVFASLNKPGAIIHYEWEGKDSLVLVVRFRSDLRWMWPYDEYAIGDVWYGYDSTQAVLHLHDSAGDLYGMIGSNVQPVQTLTGAYESIIWKKNRFVGKPTSLNQVYHAARFILSPEQHPVMDIVVVGTNRGRQKAVENYQAILNHVPEEFQKYRAHIDSLLQRAVIFHSPDAEFNRWWKWALVGTDRFLVHTPGVGTALVAGYATTARGWDGGHKINGRPGYAWYFGRDSEWSGFAIDNYGDFELVRKQLEFLQQYQDLNGKIFHEISTSGVVHYDAADATPLYVILAAHYLRSSGDRAFLAKSWPHIQKAMEFLFSTDTDGDHLIENTNVGHGWVEGGKLWGAHTTFYLAALWAQALQDAAYIASVLGKPIPENKYQNEYDLVHQIVTNQFWNDSTRFYNYGKFADGSMNPEPTLLPAVAMYYQLLPQERVTTLLESWASNDYSTDWGVRIVSARSPLFNPRGYHYGSVWPLFTGWTALAEFAYGNPVQGFTHIMDNMLIKNYWEKGFVEEVMNGAVYQPGGVCPHQCWSETNILHPGIHGMLGWRPKALQQRCTIAPHFPGDWDEVTVQHLRVGNSYFTMKFRRWGNRMEYGFSLEQGEPLTIQLIPQQAAGMHLVQLHVNEEKFPLYRYNQKGFLPVELQDSVRVTIHTRGGVEVLPVVPKPYPGDSSRGWRILYARREGKTYRIRVEGRPGDAFSLRVRTFGETIKMVRGAQLGGTDSRNISTLQVKFGESKEAFVQKTIRIILQ